MATIKKEVAVGGKGGVTLLAFPSMKELCLEFAEFVKARAEEAVASHGTFTIALSGGSLVKALGTLGKPPFLDSIDWAKWHVFWSDERKVPLDHPDSNYKAAREEVLSKVPIPAGQVHTINDKLSIEAVADDYEANLKRLVAAGVLPKTADGKYPRLDLVLLGMGPDGHVASLFPRHPLLKEAARWVAPIHDSPKPPPERITVTLPVINGAAHVAFVATGAGKAEQFRTVFGPPVEEGSLPAQLVRPTAGELTWFADEAAVTLLPP